MTSLLGDGWFYISALGFLGSGALFLYLLGQYRAAVEENEESESPSPVAVLPPAAAPLLPAKEKAAPAVALPSAAPAPKAAAPAPAVSGPGYTGPERRRSEVTSSGGLSPAVAYLQNIKAQMEKFDKEIAALKNLTAQQAAQGELVLKRLGELSETLKSGAVPRSPLPAPARSVELSLEGAAPEAGASAPAPAPVLHAAPAKAATVVLEALPQEPAPAPLAAPAPAPAAAGPAEPEPPAQPAALRKGPVWPV